MLNIFKTRKKTTLTAGVLAIAIPFLINWEELRTKAYKDIVGIPTVCVGETRGVKMGDYYTEEECKDMLADRLVEFNAAIDSCVKVPLSERRRAALLAFSYNVGTGAFCRSSVVRRLNEGDPNACDSLLAYVYAGGKVVKGLQNRRQKEYALCRAG